MMKDKPEFHSLVFILNIAYHIFISPVRVLQDKDNIKLDGGIFYKVVCGILTTVSWSLTIALHVFPSVTKGLRNGNPLVLFQTIFSVISSFLQQSFVCILFFGRNGVQRLLNEGSRQFGSHRFEIVIKGTMVGTIIASTIFAMYTDKLETYILGSSFIGCPHSWDRRNASELSPWWKYTFYMDNDCLSNIMKALILIMQLAQLHGVLTWGFTHAIIMACWAEPYMVTKSMSKFIGEHSKNRYAVMENYKSTRILIGMINDIVSVTSFLGVMETVLYIPYELMGGGSASGGVTTVANILLFAQSCAKLWMAAEVNREMGLAEKIIVSSFPSVEAHTAHAIENWPGSSGLTGWNFFTITYGLLGTLSAASISYTLVTMQSITP